jgi:hypothetical protein
MSHRSMSIKLLSLASLIGVLAFAAPSVSMASAKGAHHRASGSRVAGDPLRSLAGAWMVTVTFTSNPPPGSSGTEIGLQGFNRDGLLSEWGTAGRTTGYGVWKATNDHGGFQYTFRELELDQNGNLVGYAVVKQTGTVSPDGSTYSSSGAGQLYSPSGTPLGPPSQSKVQATRMGL